MSSLPRRLILVALVTFVLAPATAHAAGVAPGSDLSSPSGAPFPTDRYTVADATQLTGVRVDLPKPNCTVRPSDCADIDVLNTLDGFNIQPRLSIPFTGAIDVASVSSDNVFLVRLSDGAVTGINQVVWEPAGEHAARRVGPAARPDMSATCSSSRTASRTAPATRSRPPRSSRI